MIEPTLPKEMRYQQNYQAIDINSTVSLFGGKIQ